MIDDKWNARCRKAKTEKAKLDLIEEFLTEDHLDTFGGYPHDSRWIGDVLVVADLDDGKERNRTMLVTYKREDLLKWFDRASRLYEQWDDDSIGFDDSLHEEAPRQ